jgi:hypothetical protein
MKKTSYRIKTKNLKAIPTIKTKYQMGNGGPNKKN